MSFRNQSALFLAVLANFFLQWSSLSELSQEISVLLAWAFVLIAIFMWAPIGKGDGNAEQ